MATFSASIEVKRNTRIDVARIARAFGSGPRAVKVGFPSGQTGGDILNRAVWNHYGTRGGRSGGGWGGPIPPRPFLANSMRANRGKYRSAMRAGAREMLLGGGSLIAVLRKLGVMGQSDIQAEITALSSPPNSPVTVKLKGSSKPLIDTGQMRQSVSWKLEDRA